MLQNKSASSQAPNIFDRTNLANPRNFQYADVGGIEGAADGGGNRFHHGEWVHYNLAFSTYMQHSTFTTRNIASELGCRLTRAEDVESIQRIFTNDKIFVGVVAEPMVPASEDSPTIN